MLHASFRLKPEATPFERACLGEARRGVASGISRQAVAVAVAQSEIFGPLEPTGTGCVHATYPFDSRILART